MHRKHQIARAASVVAGALSLGLLAGLAHAQQSDRVEITGSSIKRIAAEGALPVITINRADIDRSGATSTQELIQALPAMQGFTTTSDSVNGGGGGVTTASLRNLGSSYTLVLLNGRRVAPFNTGSTVNLEQLPLSAIERVEILADGASALYGSDAIAGVVNFITKSNTTEGGIDIKYSRPQAKGGRQTSVSLSKGFGDYDKDGFNVLVGASVQKDGKIRAADRSFSKSGVVPFSYKGTNYFLYQLSANANPPNIELYGATEDEYAFYSPGALRGGNCGTDPASFKLGNTCRFDYASTVEASPEAERRNLYGSTQIKLGKDLRMFGELMLSDTALYGRFAPPAQPLFLSPSSPLYAKYVVPYAQESGFGRPEDVVEAYYYMRLRDAGLRSNDYLTKGQHMVLGLDGVVAGFDVSGYYTRSHNTLDSNYGGGYVSRKLMNQLIDSGKWDPFAQGTDASRAAIAPAVLRDIDRSRSSLDVLSARASGPLFKAPAGMAYLGFGADMTKQDYRSDPSAISQGPNFFQPNYDDFPVGSGVGALPYKSSRDFRGAFAEVQVPVAKGLEITGALRYDSYSGVNNSANFDESGKPLASATQGNSASKATYKLAFRFQPSQQFLVRGSVGTGFRAPTMGDITAPLLDAGVIGTQRPCPATGSDPLAAGCRSIPTQYKQQSGGNPFTGDRGLKPETSQQFTLGFRSEPNNSFSAGVDYWAVEIKDGITSVPENTAFTRFNTYRSLFSVTTEAATGRPVLTFNNVPINAAVVKSTGIDIDLTLRNQTPIGRLTTNVVATYLLESYFDLGFGDGRETSLGKLGADDAVAFRILTRATASLQTGSMVNSLTMKYKPGYKDQSYTAGEATIRLATPTGGFGSFVGFEGLDVPAYYTFDWQTRYAVNKSMTVTAGLINLFDRKPPLSLKTVGGNMVGYDPRYADGRGRTMYVSGSMKF